MKTLKTVPLLIVIFGWIMVVSPIITYAEKGITPSSNCDQSVADCIGEKTQDKVVNPIDTKNPSQDINTFATFFKFLFALVLIIFLIFWLLKFINKQTKSIQNNRFIQTLGGVGLGPNRSVQVVKIGKKVMVLGVGDNVQLLGEISDEAEFEEIIEASTQTSSLNPMKNAAFSDIINKILQQEDKGTSFKKTLESQLTGLKEKRQELFKGFKNKGDRDE